MLVTQIIQMTCGLFVNISSYMNKTTNDKSSMICMPIKIYNIGSKFRDKR